MLLGLAGLRMNRAGPDNCRAEVHEKGKGGNNKARLVYFGKRTKRALEDWLEVRPDADCPYVFINTSRGRTKKRPMALQSQGFIRFSKDWEERLASKMDGILITGDMEQLEGC